MTRALVAWGARRGLAARLLLDLRAVGERAEAVARDERVAVARRERRRRHRLVGIAAHPVSGGGEVPFIDPRSAALSTASDRPRGAPRRLNGPVETVISGMLLELASVMLQRAYARPAQRLDRRDGGGG
jgi:hypothetical protein